MRNYKKNAAPGRPPKSYKKNKAIGFFICRGKDCIELLRGKIGPKGDVYVFHPRFPINEHESFHASGKYHMKIDKEYVTPLLGKGDKPLATKTAIFRTRLTPCFCLRKGKNLSPKEVRLITNAIIRYFPKIDIKKEEVTSVLEKTGFFRAHIFSAHNIKIFKKLIKRLKTKKTSH